MSSFSSNCQMTWEWQTCECFNLFSSRMNEVSNTNFLFNSQGYFLLHCTFIIAQCAFFLIIFPVPKGMSFGTFHCIHNNFCCCCCCCCCCCFSVNFFYWETFSCQSYLIFKKVNNKIVKLSKCNVRKYKHYTTSFNC